MGACLSLSLSLSLSSHSVLDNHNLNSALIISLTGDLRQYPLPVTSSQILHMESLSPTAFFLCDSDYLFYDDFITAIDFEDELEAGQIYFILPTEKLQYRLSASDMAALAVKASAALNTTTSSSSSSTPRSSIDIASDDLSNDQSLNNNQKRKNKSRISPYALMEANQINVIDHHHSSSSSTTTSISKDNNKDGSELKRRLSKSGSIRKLQRVSSRRGRLAVRSFRFRLMSTIYEEGNVLPRVEY